MNVRNFFAMAFAAFLCAGLSSCKEDLAPQKQVINQGTIQGPGEYAPYTGPTTPLQVSFEVTKASPSPRKTKSFDVTFKQQGTGDYDLMQIDWDNVPVGKTYQLVCCLRSKNEKWDATSNNAKRTVITGQLTGKIQMVQKSGKPVKALRITGTMNVPAGWINTSGKFKYKDMYFGAYLLSDGVVPATENDFMYGVTFHPNPMFAVHHDHDHLIESGPTSAPKISMLFGIPLTRVMLDKGNRLAKAENGDDSNYPTAKASDQFYHLMPAGNILHFTLRNNMAYNIRFPKTNKFWAQTCMLFNTPITFDFWKYPQNSKQMGTINCRYHISTITHGDDTYEVPINYDKLPYKLTATNSGYITLEPGDSIDFYVWGAPATSNDNSHNTNVFKIDFSKLGIELQTKDAEHPWVPYKESYETITYNTSHQEKVNQFTEGDIVTRHYLSFEKTGISDPGIFAQGASYHHTFNVSSNLMIGLVGYRWDDISNSTINNDGGTNYSTNYNYGLLQIYNPTNDHVDLKNYYLARIIYNLGNSNKGTLSNILFLSQGWDYSPYLGYTLLLPLTNVQTRGDMSEFTPMGYSENSVNFCNRNLPPGSYIAKYSSSSSETLSRLFSGKGIIIGGKGFYEAMKTTNPNLSAALNQYNIPGNSNYKTSTYAYTTAKELKENGIIGVLGIEDGRVALARGGNATNTEFNQSPGSADSGVMSRGNGSNVDNKHHQGVYLDGSSIYNPEMLNGWALIKRIPEKNGSQTFEIVDCYGPCPYNNKDKDEEFKNAFVTGFGKTNGSPLVYVRKAKICQPNGIIMNSAEPGSANSSWIKHYSYLSSPYSGGRVIGKVNR